MTNFQFTDKQKELILDNRASAMRIVGALLKRYNYYLPREEIQSVADSALCEAARNFEPYRGNSFMSYLFLFLKGSLMREMKRNHTMYSMERIFPDGSNCKLAERCDERGYRNKGFDPEMLAHESDSPEELFRLQELRTICRKALRSLPPLERNTIIGIDILGSSVTQFAQTVGYSRPYLSSIRKRAIQKMQPYFEKLAA